MRHPAAASAMAAFAAVAIAACSGGPGGVSPRLDAPNRRATTQWDQISIYAPGGTAPAKAITDGVGGPDAMAMDASGNLYVANVNTSTVTVYARGAASPSRTITSGIGIPVCLAVDSKGDLFVASATGGPGSRGKVTEYAPGGRTVIRRIDATVDTAGWHDGQRGLVVDNAGNLYAASTPFKGIASVEVFRPSETKPSRVITEGVVRPWNLAFDRLGNLYVLNGWYGLSIYAPGSSSPFAQIDEPSGTIAFDSRNRMYVSGDSGVVEYAPDHKTVIRTITAGLDMVNAMAVDRYDNLYVANSAGFLHGLSVTVYSHRDGSLMRTITDGVTQPSELLLDKSGKLYVSSYAHYE